MRDYYIKLLGKSLPAQAPLIARRGVIKAKRIAVVQRQGDDLGHPIGQSMIIIWGPVNMWHLGSGQHTTLPSRPGRLKMAPYPRNGNQRYHSGVSSARPVVPCIGVCGLAISHLPFYFEGSFDTFRWPFFFFHARSDFFSNFKFGRLNKTYLYNKGKLEKDKDNREHLENYIETERKEANKQEASNKVVAWIFARTLPKLIALEPIPPARKRTRRQRRQIPFFSWKC